MPYEIHIPLHSESAWQPSWGEQRGLHAVFMGSLDQADPSLAQTIHDSRVKPFTQALICQEAASAPVWRITLLDDKLYEPFWYGLGRLAPQRLLDRPLDLAITARQSYYQSYAELAQTAISYRYPLIFHTPTTFKQQLLQQPIPDAYLCFQSWWGRWQAFAPPDLGINIALLDVISAHCIPTSFQLFSRHLKDGQRHVVGAVGRMTLRVNQPDKVLDHWWQSAAVLAAYATFCGTGYKTTHGLGVTCVNTHIVNE